TCVIESGARFLLDPRHKHEPTLVSPSNSQRHVRLEFLRRCTEIASQLNAEGVSFWSGSPADNATNDVAFDRLLQTLPVILDYAAKMKVQMAFEPEPGMVIQTFDDFRNLQSRLNRPDLKLCVDIGHVHCLEPLSISDYLEQWHDQIVTMHIEDMKRGVHEHLRFGEGSIDFRPVIQTLKRLNYSGSINVELSRHSHMAPEVLVESFQFLSRLMAEPLSPLPMQEDNEHAVNEQNDNPRKNKVI
ncbi:MAG: sugar phosphate isomerase/epimerase, partial [Planctomycetes bacterium]|nr:sugar phosphate isomerase/epimerase [Planctomycetota bacterium]